jgi:hypothetical protein
MKILLFILGLGSFAGMVVTVILAPGFSAVIEMLKDAGVLLTSFGLLSWMIEDQNKRIEKLEKGETNEDS